MDGKTNGEELGDPNCVWKQGDAPAGDATGHPGKTGQRTNEGLGCRLFCQYIFNTGEKERSYPYVLSKYHSYHTNHS